MSWVAVGVTAVSVVGSVVGGSSQKKEAAAAAAAEERRLRKQADLEEKAAFAEYDASIDQQRQALAQRDLAEQAQDEMVRQGRLMAESVSLDLGAGLLTGQERAARRTNYFEN